jgi:hypothetical protein
MERVARFHSLRKVGNQLRLTLPNVPTGRRPQLQQGDSLKSPISLTAKRICNLKMWGFTKNDYLMPFSFNIGHVNDTLHERLPACLLVFGFPFCACA